jgi:hypothetical protein
MFFIKRLIGKFLCEFLDRHRCRALELPFATEEERKVSIDTFNYGLSDYKFKLLGENIENNYEINPQEDYRLSEYYRYTSMYKEIWCSLKEKTLLQKIKRILS